MAVSYGFFDSVGGDRKYSAAEMSQFYDSIVTNGVFQSFKGGLAVSAGTGLSVSVAAGRAIVQSRWILNDAALTLSIDAASTTYGRIDAVVIRLSESSRSISIVVKKGTPASSPVAPSLTRSGGTYEMALAYVTVAASASSVSVTDKRSDSTLCGWAAVRESVPGEIDAMLEAMKTGFDGVTYASPVAMVQGCDTKINDRITDMKTFYPEYIRNGSWGNIGNANIVTMGMFPIEKGMEYVSFETDRPLDDPSYFYTVGYGFFKNRAVGNLIFQAGISGQHDCDVSGTTRNGTKIPVPADAKMMIFMVTQSDGTNLHPLRDDSFTNYRVRMLAYYNIVLREPYVYIGNNGAIQFIDGFYYNGSIPFRTQNGLNVVMPGFGQVEKTTDQIIADLTSSDVYNDGTTNWICIRSNRTLVYDRDQSKFLTVDNQPNTTLNSSQYPILIARYFQMSGGLLYEKFMLSMKEKENSIHKILYPKVIVNGTYNNKNNLNAVCVGMFEIPDGTEYISLETNRPVDEGFFYTVGYTLKSNPIMTVYYDLTDVISNVGWDMAGTYRIGTRIAVPSNAKSVVFNFAQSDGTNNKPLRVNSFVGYDIRMVAYRGESGSNDSGIVKKLNNARHIPGNASTPLTLLHYSDIHADSVAQGRIIDSINLFETSIDDIICTGDMVANTGGAISSWWNPKVMTCIGNHDSATYDSVTGYDWTAVSMANRDAYYIAPFESGWGITHTSGTSYYYKDYATQKVRLIVMDAMLYSDGGSEATTQTSWLEGLLASAITSNLHVIIAIHAVHGGATPEPSTFTKVGQGTMPTYTDCNTPQTVIDAVASAISSGLHFVGYLCGHTHQDNIWDAEGDGKQLMYCITCAAVSQQAQWTDSDMYRDLHSDAYNLVTIDTTNTLVKLIRGGGADVDDHMRPRKMICINYSTGEIVGEEK